MSTLLRALYSPVIEGSTDPFYSVDSWETIDTSTYIWCINGCLFTTITRMEVVESALQGNPSDVLLYKLIPLAFLSLPVHDNPK